MKRIFLAWIITAFAVSLALPAAAHAQGADKASPAAKAGAKKKMKKYDFSGDNVDGDVVRPEGVAVNVREFASHKSLIRIRQDFVQEIMKAAEDV